jgi:hypothetical protein
VGEESEVSLVSDERDVRSVRLLGVVWIRGRAIVGTCTE